MRKSRTTRLMAFAVVVACAVAACSGPPPVPTIGPEGGTVTAPDGAMVIVPAGALTTQVPIAIALAGAGAPELPPGVESAGAVYALTPHGTTFAKPVTVSVPLSTTAGVTTVQVMQGSGPTLLKTNGAGTWFELAGAAVTPGEFGDTLSAETTTFSYVTIATVQRRPNAEGLFRSWHIAGIPLSGGEPVTEVPPPKEPAEGDVLASHRFGPLPAAFGDGFADAEAYSTSDGSTYWAYAEAPSDETEGYAGSEVLYMQAQSFRKEAGDATLRFTITAVSLEGKNYGGSHLIPYKCVGSPVCDLKLFGKIDFIASAWASENKLLFQRQGVVTLAAEVPHLDLDEPFWQVDAVATGAPPLWTKDEHFDYAVDDREGFVRLKRPITVEVDLTDAEIGEVVTVAFTVWVETLDQVQGETYMAGFFRDPIALEGTVLEYSGLVPVPDLQPPPEEEEAEACTTAIDPAAGTIQFEDASYDVLELPVDVEYAVITREGGSQGDVSVRLRTADDTAVAGEDYLPLDRVIFFPDGDDSPRWVEVPLVVDDVEEPVERLTLRLEDPRGCVGMGAPAVATVDIYDNDTPADPNAGTYTVGGTVTGLVGSGLVLNGFGTREVTIDQDGPFEFPQRWPDGLQYDVIVQLQPSNPSQVCSVSNGSGVVQGANVSDVLVTCAPPGEVNPHLDPTFGLGGKVSAPLGIGSSVVDMIVQPDGKVLVLDERGLSRFTASGAVDTGFGSGGSALIEFLGTSYDRAHAMALQSDGKVVVVGESQVSVTNEHGHDWAVARYLSDGSPDTSFGGTGSGVIVGDLGSTPGSPYHETLADVAVQADGKLVVGGSINRFNVGSDFLVMRLTVAGQLDNTFGSSGVGVGVDIAGATDIGQVVGVDEDGRILIAGRVAASGGTDPDIGLLRYLPNGDLDDTFGDQGVLRDATSKGDEPFDLLVLGGGEVLVAGLLNRSIAVGGPIGLLARYTSAGDPDSGFGTNGRAHVDGLWNVYDLAETSGGYVAVGMVASGGEGDGDFVVLGLTASGARDDTFGAAGLVAEDFNGGSDRAQVVAVQPDGKVLVAGQVANGMTTDLGVMRVMP